MTWVLKETDDCICSALVHNRDRMKEKVPWLWFPLWNVLLCWMSGCLHWLIMLLFYQTVPVPPSLPRGGNARKYDRLGGLWHPENVSGCLDLLFLPSSPNAIPSITMLYHNLHLLSLTASPADTCSHKVYLLRSDVLSVVWRIPLKTSIHHLLGTRLECLWTLKHCTHSQAVESMMIHSLPAHVSTGANLGRLCYPNSYPAGKAQRGRFCSTFSIRMVDLFRVRQIKCWNQKVFFNPSYISVSLSRSTTSTCIILVSYVW